MDKRINNIEAERAIDALDGMGFIYDDEAGWLPPKQSGVPATGETELPPLPEDLLDELNDAVIEAFNGAFAIKDWAARDHWRDVLTRFEDWRAANRVQRDAITHYLRKQAGQVGVRGHYAECMRDLMRFECVLTPDGKAEMYASETGPYVWFDHVLSVLASPAPTQEGEQPPKGESNG